MASQPMPVAMGVPVQAVASPSPIPTAVPLEEAVPVAMPVSTAAANAVAPTPMSMQASASGSLRFPCVTAVPFGEAVPEAMPLSMAAANAVAPPAMSMQASASVILRFPCSTDKYEQLKAMTRADAPYALASRGMTRAQWAECTDALERVHDAQFFKNCPFAQLCYWCIPLGPLQFLLCFANPITWVSCIIPVENAKKELLMRLPRLLQPLGYKVDFPDDMDDTVVFEPGVYRLRPRTFWTWEECCKLLCNGEGGY